MEKAASEPYATYGELDAEACLQRLHDNEMR
jgi:hypothetical protein